MCLSGLVELQFVLDFDYFLLFCLEVFVVYDFGFFLQCQVVCGCVIGFVGFLQEMDVFVGDQVSLFQFFQNVDVIGEFEQCWVFFGLSQNCILYYKFDIDDIIGIVFEIEGCCGFEGI